MKSSSQFTSLFFAAGLSVLTVPALAQRADDRTPPASGGSNVISTDSLTGSVSTDSSTSGTAGSDQNPIVYGPRGTFRGTRVDEPSGIGFDELDRNRDGRISLAEYTQSAAADSVSTPAGVAGRASADANGSTGGRSGATTGISGGNQGAERRADVFRQLDRNHDGYLDRDELEAARPNSAAPIAP